MKLHRLTIGGFVAALMFLGAVDFVYAGFGISPPYVRNDRLTPGSEFIQEITLVRGDPDQDLKAEITINVPGIEDWFVIDRGTEFILPAGESQVPIKVAVQVPENAAYDRYTGNIRIRTLPTNLSSGVSIALGAQIDVDIEVVDQILDFDVKRVQLMEAEEPRRRWWLDFPGKIKFNITLNNTGNGPVAPDRVAFDIYDKRGTVVLEHTEATNEMRLIEPFATEVTVAELPTFLPPGAYLVKYSIYLKDRVKREGELTLSVLPEGTLGDYEGYGFSGLSMGDKLSLVIPPLVLLVGIIAAFVLVRLLGSRDSHGPTSRPPRSPASRPARSTNRPTPPPAPSARRSSSEGVVDLSRKRGG